MQIASAYAFIAALTASAVIGSDRVEDGVGYRRRYHRHRRFAAADRRLAVADDADVDFRYLAHAHRRVAVEVILLEPPVFHRAFLMQRDRGAPKHRALDLSTHAVRVNDRAGVHGDSDFLQRHFAGVARDLHVGDASRPRRA